MGVNGVNGPSVSQTDFDPALSFEGIYVPFQPKFRDIDPTVQSGPFVLGSKPQNPVSVVAVTSLEPQSWFSKWVGEGFSPQALFASVPGLKNFGTFLSFWKAPSPTPPSGETGSVPTDIYTDGRERIEAPASRNEV